MFDYLIVGAGFAGSVLAERLARIDWARVLLIDRRPHIADNAFDAHDDAGILIHHYGPHIFHTNSDAVFDYLARFTDWRRREHRVLASVEGALVPIPINLRTINVLFRKSLTPEKAAVFLAEMAEPRERIETAEDAVVSKVGPRLYELLFKGYARKQWGREPAQLAAQVTARIPVLTSLDDCYFTDKHQAMPRDGYSAMFQRMLDHPTPTSRSG
jgi:UDP-galactopyranose mutase